MWIMAKTRLNQFHLLLRQKIMLKYGSVRYFSDSCSLARLVLQENSPLEKKKAQEKREQEGAHRLVNQG